MPAGGMLGPRFGYQVFHVFAGFGRHFPESRSR
jgi:hypothetical protein